MSNETLMKVGKWTTLALSTAGVIGTAYYAAKETVEAVDIINAQKAENPIDALKAIVPCYKKTLIIMGLTLGSLGANAAFNQKQQAQLVAAGVAGLAAVKNKAKDIFGTPAAEKLMSEAVVKKPDIYDDIIADISANAGYSFYANNITQPTLLIYIEGVDRLVRIPTANYYYAGGLLQYDIITYGVASYADYLKYLGIPESMIPVEAKDYGWTGDYISTGYCDAGWSLPTDIAIESYDPLTNTVTMISDSDYKCGHYDESKLIFQSVFVTVDPIANYESYGVQGDSYDNHPNLFKLYEDDPALYKTNMASACRKYLDSQK